MERGRRGDGTTRTRMIDEIAPRVAQRLLLALVVLIVTTASGCLMTEYDGDGFNPGFAGYVLMSLSGGRHFPDPVTLEVFELVEQPIALLIDVITFRWLWDHAACPFSGLISMILRVFAVLPGYIHLDSPWWL
jgi:hypothetical protein